MLAMVGLVLRAREVLVTGSLCSSLEVTLWPTAPPCLGQETGMGALGTYDYETPHRG